MRVAWRIGAIVAVFVAVGWETARAVMHHAGAGTPVAEVHLSAAMAGLFAGGAAAVVVGIAFVWRRQA
jgi:hypothetical protein